MGIGGGGIVEEYLIKFTARTDAAKAEISSLIDDTTEGLEKDLVPAFDDAEKSAEKFGTAAQFFIGGVALKAVSALIDGVFKLGQKLASVVVNFVKDSVQLSANIDLIKIAFVEMTGSVETADALMASLRKQAAALGQPFEQFARTARGFVPFAEGSADRLQEMLTLSQQLAVLDPVQGFRGVGIVIKEALTGNVLSLARRFELPLEALNELKAAFAESGDQETFIAGIQELIGEFGSSTDSIEAFKESLKGSIAGIKATVQEIQIVLGKPIADVLNRNLKKVGESFNENLGDIKVIALQVGATIAVMIDMVFEAIAFVVDRVQLVFSMVDTVKQIFDALQEVAVRALSDTLTTMTKSVVEFINDILSVINAALGALGIEDIELIAFDESEVKARISGALDVAASTARAFVTPFGVTGKLLSEAIFPDFGNRVQEYVDEFSDLLAVNEDGIQDWATQNEDFQDMDIDAWVEYFQEIQDIFEKNAQGVEKEAERHADKLESIERRSRDKREDAAIKFNRKRSDLERKLQDDRRDAAIDLQRELSDIEQDIAEEAQDIVRDKNAGEIEIEQEHAETLKQIRTDLERDLFDAINARDARRVFELMQEASQARSEAEVGRQERLSELTEGIEERLQLLSQERRRRIAEAQQSFAEELQDLQRHFNDRTEEMQLQLQRELADIKLAAQRQLEVEQENHEERMAQLQSQLFERLALLGKAWAEEGDITEDAMNAIVRLLGQAFGSGGPAEAILQGFNQSIQNEMNLISQLGGQLSQASAQVSAQVQSQPSPQPTGGGGGGGGVRFFQHGFAGVVDKPTQIGIAEGGVPEALFVEPVSNLRRMLGRDTGFEGDTREEEGSGGDFNINVTADRNFSTEFEASLQNKISRFVGNAIAGKRRSRRG